MLGFFVSISVLATIPLILVRPYVGILVWTWLGFMNPHKLSWGFLSEGGRLSLIVAIATLVAWLLSRESKRIPLNAVTILLGAFIVSMTLSTLNAVAPEGAWQGWDKAIKIMAMAAVMMALVNNRTRIHALVWVIVLSLGFFGVTNGLKTVMTGARYIVWGPPGSFIADNNQLALAMLMTMPLIRYLQLQTDNRLLRWGLSAAMVLTFFSVIGSHSRGAFLGLLVVITALVMKSRYRVRIGALVLTLAAIGAFFVPQSWVDRMETIQHYEEDGSAMGRLRDWKFNYLLARERPFLGGGINAYQNTALFLRLIPGAPKAANAHSVYFQVLGAQGFLGLFIFLGLAYAVWRSFSHVRKQTLPLPEQRWAYDLASMAQVSMLGFFSAG
ncbi:MAG: putative O-glycosylation ligase, exosortase A system-associated, partial [Alphaproteobacteria bacterium]